MIVATHGILANSGITYDIDAQAFITATGITDATLINAINTLVKDIKGYGFYAKFKAIYPYVGGTATTHKYNLIDPRDLDVAYRLQFVNGWTHSSTGALPNGIDAYADTRFLPGNAGMSTSSFHISNYTRTSSSIGTSRTYIGSRSLTSNTITALGWLSGGTQEVAAIAGDAGTSYSPTPALSPSTSGFKVGTTNGNRYCRLYRNGIYQPTQVLQTQNFSPHYIYIAALNTDNTAGVYSNVETSFVSIGEGLTDSENANFYTAVNKFQTTLGRNV